MFGAGAEAAEWTVVQIQAGVFSIAERDGIVSIEKDREVLDLEVRLDNRFMTSVFRSSAAPPQGRGGRGSWRALDRGAAAPRGGESVGTVGALIIATLVAWLAPVRATEAPAQFEPHVQACAPCHGAQGQGTGDAYFPRLAGKPAGYLFNQLAAFKSGRRKYSPMNYRLEYQNEAFPADSRLFRRAKASAPRACRRRRERGGAGAREVASDAGRLRQGHPGLRELPWSAFYGHGAGDSGPDRPQGELPQRAARRVALRDSHGSRARLHATRRRASHRRRRHGRRGLVVLATGAVRSLSGRQGKLSVAVRLRERTKLRSRKVALCRFAALQSTASAPRFSLG